MKIIYIAASTVPSREANSVHVMKMCQAIALNKHEVFLFVPKRNDKNIKTENIYHFYGIDNCFKIAKIPFFMGKFGLIFFSFLAIVKSKLESPQLVYTRFLYPAFIGLLLGLPVIYEIHSSFEGTFEKIVFKLMKKNKLKKIVVISSPLYKYLTSKYKIDKNKIFIAPDGADPFKSESNFKKNRYNEYELDIGYVGNLYRGKGMEIIAELGERCPWAKFNIVGGFPDDLFFWKKKLKNLKNIVFHGYVPHCNVNRYLDSFDVLIAPYQKKVTVMGQGDIGKWMSPLKIFEYMAAGKVILSSDLSVLKEVLEHGRNSLLASPEDIEKWVSNLELVRKDVKLRMELGRNAKEDFESNYTWKSRADNILNSIKI